MPSTPGLPMWVIYKGVSDRPGPYTVRQWLTIGQPEPLPTSLVADFLTLDDARASVPPDAICLGRFAEDDATIVEVWL